MSKKKKAQNMKVVNKKEKISVKRRFVNAMKRLKRMKANKQRDAALGASAEFIRDVSGFMSQLRNRPQLVNAKQRKVLEKHRKKLQKLIHAKTPLSRKRLILSQTGGNLLQTGGILPALIPIICALIGAGGGIAGAATSAAIIKN